MNIKLDFVVIGGQKCGSSYIQSIIGSHPHVFLVKGEVPLLEDPDFFDDGLSKLEKLLAPLDQSLLIGIKRPNYLSKPEVVERLIQINKEVKAVVILRNPLERLKSAYFHYMIDGFIPVTNLNSGVKKILDKEWNNEYPRSTELINFGFYYEPIKRYKEKFKDNLLVLFYDDLRKEPDEIIRTCFSFLGVNPEFKPETEILNHRPQKVNYSLIRTWLLTKKNKYRYDYNPSRTRLFVKEQSKLDQLMCKRIDQLDYYLFSRIFSGNKKPQFDTKTKNKLVHLYEADILNLQEYLSIDLSHWLK